MNSGPYISKRSPELQAIEWARRQDELNPSSDAFFEVIEKNRVKIKPELDALTARIEAYQQTDEYKQYLATQTA